MPVPLHWTRLAPAASTNRVNWRAISPPNTGAVFLPSTLVRRKRTQRQVGLTAKAR